MKQDNYDRQVDIARDIFLQYDQPQLIRKFGLCADETWIHLRYLGADFRICRADGHVEEQIDGAWQECRSYSTVMTIYDLLCWSKGKAAPALYHQWRTVGSFVVTGVQDTDPFTRRFAAQFQGRADALKAACTQLGGTLQPPMAGADVTCRMPVTDFFPVMLQFWDADEEYPPQMVILWDRNADSFLRFETMFFLQGDLLARLARQLK